MWKSVFLWDIGPIRRVFLILCQSSSVFGTYSQFLSNKILKFKQKQKKKHKENLHDLDDFDWSQNDFKLNLFLKRANAMNQR